jgi:hypothetical protein
MLRYPGPYTVDPSWYERWWLRERPPSERVALSRRARAVAESVTRYLVSLAF